MGNVQVQQQLGGGGDGCGGGGGGGGGGGQIMEVKAEKNNENKEKKTKEIVLKVYMHCEGCGAKVFKCLKGLQGIEEIKTDVKHNRVIVKGQNADPLKVLERIKKKYSKHAELLYPKPKSKANVNKEVPNKQEPQTKVIVLKMHMHCEGCANDIKNYIERMKGILYVEPDMKKSTVTVRGIFDPQKLVETITKKLGKYAEIVGEGSNDKGNENGQAGNKKAKQEEIIFHYPPPQYSVHYIYPTQTFSDENVFSCSVM